MFQNKNISVISSNRLFEGMRLSAVKKVFNSKNFSAVKEGTIIFQAGERSNYVYLVLEGEVKLKYTGTRGSNASIRKVKNEFFGEQEVLEKTTRISSAIADTDCILYPVSREEIFLLIKTHEDILNNLSFKPAEGMETDEETIVNNEQEQNQITSEAENQEKEIILDDDLADYSFGNPALNEQQEFKSDEYISYSKNEDSSEDLIFNSFSPEKNQGDEKSSGEKIPDFFYNDELNDKHNELFNENSDNDLINDKSELFPITDNLEYIPAEPQKFGYVENDSSLMDNLQPATETLILIETASKFINDNIAFPLNEIKRLSDILNKNRSLHEAVRVNELIKKHSDLIKSIVSTSLSFISQSSNQNLKKQNIKSLLANILNFLSEYAGKRNIKLFQKIETDAEVEADEIMLYNVFLQLTKNACDSMPEGGNIFVTAVKENNNVKIEFVDDGYGIPSSLAIEVFDPMFSHGKKDGTGLGLSVSKKIIRDHKGEISIDGELGEGTRIIITLPIA